MITDDLRGRNVLCSRDVRFRWQCWVVAVLVIVTVQRNGAAHDLFIMNSNHTDYNWNAPAAEYDAAMLRELDFYLQQITSTASAPSHEQSRYSPDCWWWLYLYEHNRSPQQFQSLIDAMKSGHVTIPLNPMVTLYGALPTEAAIRAGYYPGTIQRRFGVDFRLGEYRENHTIPWGLASIWAGSGLDYAWKGVCGCAQTAPARTASEIFVWQGPDDKTLLFKWYNLLGSNRDWGGYSEARDNLSSTSQLDAQIERSLSRMPMIPVTGLFGAGWDDVSWESTAVVDAVRSYNATSTGNTAVVSNGIDFFEALENAGVVPDLPVLRGGWGNDWDMWPASLAERTARVRRALERLRTAELLAVHAQLQDPAFWAPVRRDIEDGLTSVWKYFEHGWTVIGGGPTLQQMQADKEAWASDIETAVESAISRAEEVIANQFATPAEDRVAVFNPLGFVRTDVVDLSGVGGHRVVDVATGTAVPAQVLTVDGHTTLRFVARDVPALGYRVYRLESGSQPAAPAVATVTPAARVIESSDYRIILGERGQITEAVRRSSDGDLQLAGPGGLADLERGQLVDVVAENVGPVSATLRMDLSDPERSVRVTLFGEVDRVEVDSVIGANLTGLNTYRFHAGLDGADIRFEEVGAIARPGYVSEGGDFLQGTRASRMTLNHFVSFVGDPGSLVISNWDAFAMQVNDSTDATFDLTGDAVRVVVTEQTPGAGTSDQGGDRHFRNRFAISGSTEPTDPAQAMRFALAHQNPLHPVRLQPNTTGPLTEPVLEPLSLDLGESVVIAFKPAEDAGAGYVIRFWELGSNSSTVTIGGSALDPVAAWRTTLIETDVESLIPEDDGVTVSLDANEIGAVRLVPRLESPRIRRPTNRRISR
jgi:alpha-mannosidase